MVKVKSGRYLVGNWYVCKIGGYWYLLSMSEYEQYKNNLADFTKENMASKFATRKQLVDKYSREFFYGRIFEN